MPLSKSLCRWFHLCKTANLINSCLISSSLYLSSPLLSQLNGGIQKQLVVEVLQYDYHSSFFDIFVSVLFKNECLCNSPCLLDMDTFRLCTLSSYDGCLFVYCLFVFSVVSPQLLAVFRFASLIMAYAVCKLRHWWAMAVRWPLSLHHCNDEYKHKQTVAIEGSVTLLGTFLSERKYFVSICTLWLTVFWCFPVFWCFSTLTAWSWLMCCINVAMCRDVFIFHTDYNGHHQWLSDCESHFIKGTRF